MKPESTSAAVREWKLSRLTEGIGGVEAPGGGGTVVTALACDSRRVQPGALFFALAGATTDGRLHIEEAVRRGAALELSHVLLLIDDPQATVVEPLFAQRDRLPKLYDFALMYHFGAVSQHLA